MKQSILKGILPHLIILSTFFFIVFLPIYQQNSFSPQGTFYPKVHRIFQDYYYYLSVIKQGRSGYPEINQYTTENEQSGRVHIYYLLLGKTGKILNISDIGMYYVGMMASLIIFYIFVNLLINLFFKKKWKWLTMAIVFLGSPFPNTSIFLFNRQIPIGSGWWTNMDMHERLSLVPHHYSATALMTTSIYFLIRFIREKKILYSILSGLFLSLSIIFFAMPGVVYLIAFSISVFLYLLLKILQNKSKYSFREIRNLIYKKQNYIYGLFFIVISSGISLFWIYQGTYGAKDQWGNFLNWEYNVYKDERYPYLFSVLFISYGLLPIFVFWGIVSLLRKISWEVLFVILLFLSPFGIYILSANGFITIPKLRCVYSAPYLFAGILAVQGIIYLVNRVKFKYFQHIIYLLFLMNSILGLYSYWYPRLWQKNIYSNIYLPDDYLTAMEFLNNNTPPFSNVLASFSNSTFLPAFTLNKVYVGHENMKYFWDKWEKAERFFQGVMEDREVNSLIQDSNIEYVFWTWGQSPESYLKYMNPVFEKGMVRIYKVSKTDLKKQG